MAGRPKNRAMARAELAAMDETTKWLSEQKALLAARDDLTDAQRAAADGALKREYVQKTVKAMTAARRKAKRDMTLEERARYEIDASMTKSKRRFKGAR